MLVGRPLAITIREMLVIIRMGDLSGKSMVLPQTIASMCGSIKDEERMQGMEVDHHSTDQDWQKLQVHIDQTFGRYLRGSLDLIEHKPRQAVYLLSASTDDRKDYPQTV